MLSIILKNCQFTDRIGKCDRKLMKYLTFWRQFKQLNRKNRIHHHQRLSKSTQIYSIIYIHKLEFVYMMPGNVRLFVDNCNIFKNLCKICISRIKCQYKLAACVKCGFLNWVIQALVGFNIIILVFVFSTNSEHVTLMCVFILETSADVQKFSGYGLRS